MPTYQYRCTECGEDLEAVQKFSDAPLDTCPTCGGRLRKVFNAVGVVFKGSGFYRTDSRNGSANGDGADSRTAEKKSGAETKSGDKEPAGSGSARSNSSNKDSSNKDNSNKTTPTKAAQQRQAARLQWKFVHRAEDHLKLELVDSADDLDAHP
jgi:putative FmdB family regulatory protein